MRRAFLKSFALLFAGLFVVVIIASAMTEKEDAGEEETQMSSSSAADVIETAGQSDEMRGLWVPYMSLIGESYTEESFKENFAGIADSAKELNLSALFVHVRPFCDALYKSDYFPWSHIVSGEQGKDPGFDPLEYMLEYAHSLGLELHAWINPLRVKSTETPTAFSGDNPYMLLKDKSPEYFIECESGIYLNPAYTFVRELIIDGVREIVENYDVDGIHFDDYFYPSEDESIDEEAYAEYCAEANEPPELTEWRQQNINELIKGVYSVIKATDENVQFGISPQGNIENDLNMGADIYTWCENEGYIDYICPQLYYSFENPALGFDEALSEWIDIEKHEGLKMYLGLALYKAGSDADDGTWLLSSDNIKRQIERAREENLGGIIIYSAGYLKTEQTGAELENAASLLS